MPTDNNGSNGLINGDILGSLSSDVSLIRGDTSAIRHDTSILSSIDSNINVILQNVNKWSQQDVKSRIYDTSNSGRSGQAGPFNRSRGDDRGSRWDRDRDDESRSRSSAKKYKGDPEDFLDAFFEELEKDLFGSGIKGALQQNMKDFANAMGLQLEDLPSTFGKMLATNLKQSKLGQTLTDQINKAVSGVYDRSMSGMRKGIHNYYTKAAKNGDMSEDEAREAKIRWDTTYAPSLRLLK